jgi:hypothetical protein
MLKHLYNHEVNMYMHSDDKVQQIVLHLLHIQYYQTIINCIH